MDKQEHKKGYTKRLKVFFYFVAFLSFLSGVAIYAFFRNVNNMVLFNIFPKPSFLISLYSPIKSESILSNMFIYNLPYGLWCLSGLLLVRALWLHNEKWRAIYSGVFIAVVMSYVILKLPGIIPGTFDVLDLIFMGSFAFVESLLFNLFIRRSIQL